MAGSFIHPTPFARKFGSLQKPRSEQPPAIKGVELLVKSRNKADLAMSLNVPDAPNAGLFKGGYNKYALPVHATILEMHFPTITM